MRALFLALVVVVANPASGQYALAPLGATFRFAGEETLKVETVSARISELIVTIRGDAMPVPKAELKDLPRVFIDSMRYELPLGSASSYREVFFEAGERGDPFANPPVPPKVVGLVLTFDDGKYSGCMTTTPIDDTTSEVWLKVPGKAPVRRATVKRMPPTSLELPPKEGKKKNAEPQMAHKKGQALCRALYRSST